MNWRLFTPFPFQTLLHLTIYWLKQNDCIKNTSLPPTHTHTHTYIHTYIWCMS